MAPKSNGQRIIGWNKVVPRLRLAVRAWYYRHDTLATMPITGMRTVLRFHTAIQEAILAMLEPYCLGDAGSGQRYDLQARIKETVWIKMHISDFRYIPKAGAPWPWCKDGGRAHSRNYGR